MPESAAASFRLEAVSSALCRLGNRTKVFTTKFENAPANQVRRFPSGGVLNVRRWPVLRDKSGYVRGYLPYISFDVPLFFRLLLGRKPQVLLVEPPPTTGAISRAVCAIRRVPYVWYAADVWSDATRTAGAPGFVSRVVEALEKFAMRGAAGVVAVSDGVAERVKELGAQNVLVVPNGIDTLTYCPDVEPLSVSDLSDLGITGRYLLYAGTASEWQEAEIFASSLEPVLRESSDLQLVYVGQGARWDQIGDIASHLNSTLGRAAVLQLGQRLPTEVARLLRGAEFALVSLAPGKGYDFAYPTKVLAALAAGTPVIYSGTGQVANDIREHGLGYVAEHAEAGVESAVSLALRAGRSEFDPASLHAWVVENRSLQAMGDKVAAFLLECAS